MATLRWSRHGHKPDPSERLHGGKGAASPVLFFVMLAIIIGSILIFLILRPSGHGALLFPLPIAPSAVNAINV